MPARQGLVSTLDLNSVLPHERAASASSSDTSGHPDKVPVLSHRGWADDERSAVLHEAVTDLRDRNVVQQYGNVFTRSPALLNPYVIRLFRCCGACPGASALWTHGSYRYILSEQEKNGNGSPATLSAIKGLAIPPPAWMGRGLLARDIEKSI